jgi:hypothetical protein
VVNAWSDIAVWVSAVPPGVWVAAMLANIVLTAVTWSAARRRLRRAGQRLADPGLISQGRAKDTALTLASLIPAGLFWLMVLGGSLHGLVAFGHDTLGWRGGWEYLVPGTLDGVSVTFAMLAFRAVKRGKIPDRCYRVVWGAALASATINFAHEYGKSGNALAGGYLALLSLFGMFMFDEFLNQFEQGAQQVRRENPKFGARWLTWPTNTFLAWVAWRNHPPAEGTPGTVANAVANLNRVLPARPRPLRTVPSRAARSASAGDDAKVTVPSTPATLSRWVSVWMAMCQRPDLAWASMQDERLAREHFNLSTRALRNIRYAAMTGALRQRAQELDVDLPQEYGEAAGQPLGNT